MDKGRFIIIGGGVAGLAAACKLVDQGVKTLILEASPFPSHKICGEFFSPECLPQLAKWGVHFEQTIDRALFVAEKSSFVLPFRPIAGSMSHKYFDQKLLDYALKGGAQLFSEVAVSDVVPETTGFTVSTEKWGRFPCSHLFIASGKLPFFPSKMGTLYQGAKSYFSDLKLQAPLMMFSFSGCYVGVSLVEKDVYNVALLSSRPNLPTIEELSHESRQFAEVFQKGKMVFSSWMKGSVPPFGFRKNPYFTNCFFIGDALNTIPPASGVGLSLSIACGILSAEYALKNDAAGFLKTWKKEHHQKIRLAKFLHHCLLRPQLLKTLNIFSTPFPFLKKSLFDYSRVQKPYV